MKEAMRYTMVVILERVTVWRQRWRRRRGEGSDLEEVAAWRRGLGGNIREEARGFSYCFFFFFLITLSDL